MSAGEYCNREVVIIGQGESVRKAVELMRHHHVGSVVVAEMKDDAAKPLGILTDRDIVLELLAEDVDLAAVNVGDVMSGNPVTVEESTPLLDTLQLMKKKGVRRVLVVNAKGYLLGMLALDDILDLLGEQIDSIVELIRQEQSREKALRD